MSVPVFETRGVRVVRGGRALVDGVSLTVEAGELVAILGENGAGKSTLLRLLAGDFAPDAGEVLLNGRQLSRWSAREQARQRAVLPQQSSLAFPFAAVDVVLMGRSAHDAGRPGARDRAIAADALQRADASALAGRRYPTLSGGERARVMLARAFAQVLRDPSVPRDDGPRGLLLDEPSAALDVAHQQSAFAAIRDLARDDGVAAVAVLHDVNAAAAFADRVALMKAGRLIAVGPVEETLTARALGDCFSVPMRRIDDEVHGTPLFAPIAAARTPRASPGQSRVERRGRE